MSLRNRKLCLRPNVVSLEVRETPAAAFALAGTTLIPFDTDFPTVPRVSVPITGLTAGDTLQAIDVRPQNGHLYGLATDGVGGVRLYDISTRSGKATALTAAAQTFTTGAGAAVAISGSRFEIDFNPTVDRIRIVSDTGVNFRMNPNTGTIVDGVAGAGIDPDGVLTNGASTATGGGTAYTNSVINTVVTTQYTIDSTTKQLLIQNPPNNGTLTNGVSISVDGTTPLAFTAVGGFDIPSSVSVVTSNSVATGNAWAVLTVGGVNSLYTINLTSGLATAVSKIGDGSATINGLAVAEAEAGGVPVVALDSGNIIRFLSNTPGTNKSVAVTGVLASETLVGFDFRPATGQLIGVGVDSALNTGSIYLIDPQTAVATLLVAGTQSQVAFVTTAAVPVDLPASGYGIDFNPTVDRIRVVTQTGLNFRLNPLTGLGVDGDAVATGTNPDLNINGGATGVSATAYTNSFNGTTVTTQYTLDAVSDSLFIQTPPNSGVQTAGKAITLNGAPLDFTEVSGFDIAPGVVTLTSNSAVPYGSALASLSVGGVSNLYRINLTTGVATIVANAGTAIGALTMSDDATARSFELYAAGTGPGIANAVAVYEPDGSLRFTITPYEASFTGGVSTATADVTGDGVDDIITGTGNGGGPLVKVFNGVDGSLVSSFFAYESSFRGGVIVAAGDTNGDGKADIITGTGVGGGPRVRVISGADQNELANYFAYEESFRGGVLVGTGDLNGDGKADVITGTGVGGGPRVRALSGATTTELANFFAYESTFRGGVFVTGGNVTGSVNGEIITGTGPGGGPLVRAFDSTTFADVGSFLGADVNFRGGVSVSAVDRNGDGVDDIVTGTGIGITNSVRVVTLANNLLLSASPFGSFNGGVNVG